MTHFFISIVYCLKNEGLIVRKNYIQMWLCNGRKMMMNRRAKDDKKRLIEFERNNENSDFFHYSIILIGIFIVISMIKLIIFQ